MDKTVGFIGSGNMGGAMINGMLRAGVLPPEKIIVSDINGERLRDFNERLGVITTADSLYLTEKSDIIILAVKPEIYALVINQIKPAFKKEKLIVTIAAGKTIKSVEDILGNSAKVVRTMPNTPALVGAGMAVICHNENVSAAEASLVKEIFDSLGRSEILPEKLVDAVTGISGSSPAYTFMYIEALADAGVKAGIPRGTAYLFAAQAVMGAALMLLETKMHPGELKDMVCSPAGSTIDAVASLEENGFRSAVIEAVGVCVEKSRKLGEN